MIFFWFKWDKVVQLHLESFCSGNLANFHLEWRKSNRNGMIHKWNRENQTRTGPYVNGIVKPKIYISYMPALLSPILRWLSTLKK